MPLFDFLCKDCQTTSELLVRASSEPACPKCGSKNLEKQLALIAPAGKTAGILASARSQASREGHFSNYKASERPRSK